MQFAYLHGFASGSLSRKGQELKSALAPKGVTLHLPDLNVPTFNELSLAAMLDAVSELDERSGDPEGWGFIGSSLGGWLAARFAQLHPDRVTRLLLLCPAFRLSERWPTLLPDGAIERWRDDGALTVMDGSGRPARLHYAFYEEACQQPATPSAQCPTFIVHGRADDRVPIDLSRAYAANHPQATLVEVDDGHDLLASMDRIRELATSWLTAS